MSFAHTGLKVSGISIADDVDLRECRGDVRGVLR